MCREARKWERNFSTRINFQGFPLGNSALMEETADDGSQ